MIELAIMFCMTSGDGVSQCHREALQAQKFSTVAECLADLDNRVVPQLSAIGVEVVAAYCVDPEKSDAKNLAPRVKS